MIIEVVNIKVKAGDEARFEAAFREAVDVFRKAKGCKGLHLQKCFEEPDFYQAIIRWETLEDHTVSFRESDLFRQWRSLVGPFFAEPPSARHFNVAVERADF